jgi:choline transport protein
MIWKMSKQKAFPFSTYFGHISHHTSIPVRALMAFIVICMLVGLLVLGSHLAFYAILSGGGIAIQISFIVPILCVVLRGRSKVLPAGGPRFDLGNRWGYVVNVVSLLWSVVVVLFYVFPQYMPVVGMIANMNWAIAIIGAVVLFAGVTWVAKASKHFQVEAPAILEGQAVTSHGQEPGQAAASAGPVKPYIAQDAAI